MEWFPIAGFLVFMITFGIVIKDTLALGNKKKPEGSVGVIQKDPKIMGGTPVFVGTQVPVQTLLDYLETNRPLSDFLNDFPSVTHTQTTTLLKDIKSILAAGAYSSR